MAEQFNVNNPGADLNDIDNSPLVEAIKKMREDFSDETRDEVLNKVIFDTTFFVPAIFDSSTELTSQVSASVRRLSSCLSKTPREKNISLPFLPTTMSSPSERSRKCPARLFL